MDNFTPLDTLRALLSPLTTCLPPLHLPRFSRSAPEDAVPAERDELEGLLGDSEDERADAVSLRSEGGMDRRRQAGSGRSGRKGTRRRKGVEMCGLELFGRPKARRGRALEDGADDLSDSDTDEHPRAGRSHTHAHQPRAQPWQQHHPTLSSATLSLPDEPDAPSLTPADIARLAATHFQPEPPTRPMVDREVFQEGVFVLEAEEGTGEVEQEGEGEDARELDEALTRTSRGFEGFPGSGTEEFGDFAVPSPSVAAFPAAQLSRTMSTTAAPVKPVLRSEEEDDPEGDFGSLYARSSRRRGDGGEGSSSTPSLASHASRSRARPQAVATATRSRASKTQASRSAIGPSPPSSATESVRTPTAAEGGEAFEGWIGSGTGGHVRGQEGWPSTGLSRKR